MRAPSPDEPTHWMTAAGQQVGPEPFSIVTQRVEAGQIPPTTLVWWAGADEWATFDDVTSESGAPVAESFEPAPSPEAAQTIPDQSSWSSPAGSTTTEWHSPRDLDPAQAAPVVAPAPQASPVFEPGADSLAARPIFEPDRSAATDWSADLAPGPSDVVASAPGGSDVTSAFQAPADTAFQAPADTAFQAPAEATSPFDQHVEEPAAAQVEPGPVHHQAAPPSADDDQRASDFAALVARSGELAAETGLDSRLDHRVVGGIIAAMVRDGFVLIDLVTSDPEEPGNGGHRMRFETPATGTQVDVLLARIQGDPMGSLATLRVGCSELSDRAQLVGHVLRRDADSAFLPAPSAGHVSFDAAPALGRVSADVHLVVDLDTYVGDHQLDDAAVRRHLQAIVHALRTLINTRTGS